MFDRINATIETRKFTQDHLIRTDKLGRQWLTLRTDLEEELHEENSTERELREMITNSRDKALGGQNDIDPGTSGKRNNRKAVIG